MSEVYFAPVGYTTSDGMLEAVGDLFRAAEFGSLYGENDLVAVKLHFGELGCTSFIPPFYIREIVKILLELESRPFLTDTGTLYEGKRTNARDHLMTAHANSFNLSSTGAPIIIGDGLRGSDVERVQVGGKHFKEVEVAGAIAHSDALMVVSHVTGHALMGYAGAIKNLGMGCVGRKIKLAIHEETHPFVRKQKCSGCGECEENCPAQAIKVEKDTSIASIDLDSCIGCGECVSFCPNEAISIRWKGKSGVAQEKLAEAALGVVKSKHPRVGYFNFLLSITRSCDCASRSSAPMVPDIGVLASLNPVSLDQASSDLVLGAPFGSGIYSNPQKRFSPVDGGRWDVSLQHAEEIGLGSRKYKLVNISQRK